MRVIETGLEIHRLLDEAFAGIEVTPEVQDLKEEIRANLVSRAGEFAEAGLAPGEAARRAINELGDIRAVVDETTSISSGIPAWERHRVRPTPAFVVRTVVLSLVGAGALVVAALPFLGVDLALAGALAAVAVAAVVGGFIVGDALRQETTTNYPVPARRARAYGVATGLALAGAGAGALWSQGLALAWLVGGVALFVAAIVIFAQLGATQTNRHKPWVVQWGAEHGDLADNFSEDPAAAARFGIYTASIWIAAFAAFVVLGMTVGWAWSWLTLVAALVVMMLVLARMLFGTRVSSAG
ncbi:permease prefix domain 1-containing protein [Luedemannella flava]